MKRSTERRLGLRAIVGSIAQFVGMAAFTLVWGLLSLLTWPAPYRFRYWFITRWVHFNMWWLKVTCGLDYEVRGLENIPPGPGVVMSKHQSTWEAIALGKFFIPQTWVLKRELLRIPVFGWALSLLQPIGINRGAHADAVRQILKQGSERLKAGRWVVIFPEGTRVAPGERGRYHPTGALLASLNQAPIVPVAHNAGEFWGRRQFFKRPGTIQVRIGPPIDPRDKKPKEINKIVEDWIESQMAEISTRR